MYFRNISKTYCFPAMQPDKTLLIYNKSTFSTKHITRGKKNENKNKHLKTTAKKVIKS